MRVYHNQDRQIGTESTVVRDADVLCVADCLPGVHEACGFDPQNRRKEGRKYLNPST